MPNQCLKCGKIYSDLSVEFLKGCSNNVDKKICSNKSFLYMKKMPENKEEIEISKEKKELILNEIEKESQFKDNDAPIILKLENIKIIEQGKYEIDINKLMKKEDKVPIYKVEEGTYILDINYLLDEK